MTDQSAVPLFTTTYQPAPSRDVARARIKYLRALVKGDDQEAGDVVRGALDSGWGPVTVYLDILADTMVVIGEMWHSNEITVAHEHQATQITTRQMAILRSSYPRSHRTGLKAVVSAVERDGHMLGASIFADFLTFSGWDVDFLGAGVPVDDLTRLISERAPDLLVLSVTMEEGIAETEELVKAVQRLPRPPKIILGGPAIAGKTQGLPGIEVDFIAKDIPSSILVVKEMFGLTNGAMPLDVVLHRVGEKVKSLRNARGWSQQELADEAGLDRTYLSGVERGRQNLTLGAMKKLSDALGASMADLISFSRE